MMKIHKVVINNVTKLNHVKPLLNTATTIFFSCVGKK